MVKKSILKVLLIVHIIPVVISGGNDMEEKTETGNVDYMLTKDYCSMDEFEDLHYYLFCDTLIHKGVANFESKPSIICSETQNIGEAKELYQEFRKKLPLDSEEKDEEGEERNVVYVSPDCKWVITNKWSEHKTISTQMLFHEKEKVREKVSETDQGVQPILIVKDGDTYEEMKEEHYAKLSEITWIGFYGGGYDSFKKINAEGNLLAEINYDFSVLAIRKIEDGTVAWSFALQGMQEKVEKIRDDIREQDKSILGVYICQFEGNEEEGWLIVQAGPSSFFRIAYPSGEVAYLGEYMYSPCFSPDGKYVAYSDVDYDNRVDMEPTERAQVPPQGIYVKEVETGKTAYIYWPYKDPAQDFMEYRNFMWIEKEGFEEYMRDTGADDEIQENETTELYQEVLGKGSSTDEER